MVETASQFARNPSEFSQNPAQIGPDAAKVLRCCLEKNIESWNGEPGGETHVEVDHEQARACLH